MFHTGFGHSIFNAQYYRQYSFWLMHREVSPTARHRSPRPLPSPSFHAQEEVSRSQAHEVINCRRSPFLKSNRTLGWQKSATWRFCLRIALDCHTFTTLYSRNAEHSKSAPHLPLAANFACLQRLFCFLALFVRTARGIASSPPCRFSSRREYLVTK